MAENPENDGTGKQPESHNDTSREHDYEVGYRKPPTATKFKKGQSGNPFGRPRKPKLPKYRLADAPADTFLGKEAYRPIAAIEEGKEIELPLSQALIRGLEVMALKGKNRLAAQFLLKRIDDGEERHLQRRIDNYVDLREQKRRGEALIAEHKRKNFPAPDIIPHPDDIVLKPDTAEAFVNGPETKEDVYFYKYTMALRDHLLLRLAHDRMLDPKILERENECSAWLIFAHALDALLPKRMRWPHKFHEASILVHYESLSLRECKQRIKTETEYLLGNRPQLIFMTNELEQEIGRITHRVLATSKKRQKETPSGTE